MPKSNELRDAIRYALKVTKEPTSPDRCEPGTLYGMALFLNQFNFGEGCKPPVLQFELQRRNGLPAELIEIAKQQRKLAICFLRIHQQLAKLRNTRRKPT